MDNSTIITLLTIAVVLLSVVIIVVIVIAIVLLVKVKKLITDIQHIARNVAVITEWLTPTKLFGEIFKLIRRK
jgi:hypothetical protein